MRTARQECLDYVIVLNDRHLRRLPREFVPYYNDARPHRSLDLTPPSGCRGLIPSGRDHLISRPVLGGLASRVRVGGVRMGFWHPTGLQERGGNRQSSISREETMLQTVDVGQRSLASYDGVAPDRILQELRAEVEGSSSPEGVPGSRPAIRPSGRDRTGGHRAGAPRAAGERRSCRPRAGIRSRRGSTSPGAGLSCSRNRRRVPAPPWRLPM